MLHFKVLREDYYGAIYQEHHLINPFLTQPTIITSLKCPYSSIQGGTEDPSGSTACGQGGEKEDDQGQHRTQIGCQQVNINAISQIWVSPINNSIKFQLQNHDRIVPVPLWSPGQDCQTHEEQTLWVALIHI